MSTRATIEIKDEFGDCFYVYRGHDGFPEIVTTDINCALAVLKRKQFKSPDASHVATVLLGEMYDESRSVPEYEITKGWHGDESYKYFCHFDKAEKKYVVRAE